MDFIQAHVRHPKRVLFPWYALHINSVLTTYAYEP